VHHERLQLYAGGRTDKDDRSTSSADLLIGRLVLRDAGSSVFQVAGFAGNAFRFAFTGNLLIELIDMLSSS
jgi:hypothetical protein